MTTESAGEENTMCQAPKPQGCVFMAALIVVRILAMALAVTAISVILTTTQTFYFYRVRLRDLYSYSSAFKFMICADTVVCGFSLLSPIFVYLSTRKHKASMSSCPKKHLFMLLHDRVMTVLIVFGCAAAIAIGYVGCYGQEMMGGDAHCDRMAKFCHNFFVAVALSYLTFLPSWSSPLCLLTNSVPRAQANDDELTCPLLNV